MESLYHPNVKNSYSNGYVTLSDHTTIPKARVGSNRRKGDNGKNVGTNAHKVKQVDYSPTKSYKAKINTIERKVVPIENYNTKEQLINNIFGNLPESDFDDLKHRSSSEVRNSLSTIFSELPSAGLFLDTRIPVGIDMTMENQH